MLYRPNFCCHCGEKIVRARWTPLTSRRFCEFCEVEQKEYELIPKIGSVIAILVGAAGLTAYLGAGNSATTVTRSEATALIQPLRSENRNSAVSDNANANRAKPAPDLPRADLLQREALSNSSTEAVYHCGAITRKGSPCTRRVKSKGRCWQHIGQTVAKESRD